MKQAKRKKRATWIPTQLPGQEMNCSYWRWFHSRPPQDERAVGKKPVTLELQSCSLLFPHLHFVIFHRWSPKGSYYLPETGLVTLPFDRGVWLQMDKCVHMCVFVCVWVGGGARLQDHSVVYNKALWAAVIGLQHWKKGLYEHLTESCWAQTHTHTHLSLWMQLLETCGWLAYSRLSPAYIVSTDYV